MNPEPSQSVGFIGAGRLATALAPALHSAGYGVTAIWSRSLGKAARVADAIPDCKVSTSGQEVVDRTAMVFVAVPDDAIKTVVTGLNWSSSKSVVHCSGAAGLDVLTSATRQGAMVGSFHPLQTFSASSSTATFAGITVVVDGDHELREVLSRIAVDLGGTPRIVAADHRPLYHAAAVMASNYLVTLAEQVVQLSATYGWTRGEALEAFLPLMRGTMANLEQDGLPGALTGPIARGDVGTVTGHVKALSRVSAEIGSLYSHLGLATIRIAAEKNPAVDAELDQISNCLLESIGKERTASCA